MRKTEKVLCGVITAVTLAVGAATVVLITKEKPQRSEFAVESAVKINADDLLTELKVGKYYLQDGTDEEYIEVYSDQTMCLFGFTLPDDASEARRESLKKHTERRYYALSDKVKHIGLGDTLFPDNWKKPGYSYLSENIICFSTVEGTLNYIYRAE
ncbi:MAG: hypothetical protein K2J80_10375 [Oscillospiraceae bacterium]|nr:hypothetical protein [Oscillospiraceae bacterium]